MQGMIIGIIVGIITPGWLVVFVWAFIHGVLMGFWKMIRKPSRADMEFIVKQPENERALTLFRLPLLEAASQAIFFLITASITYAIRLIV